MQDAGFGELLREINQQSQMVEMGNTMHDHLTAQTFALYADPTLRAHFLAAAAEVSERGWRVKKLKQSKPIDGCISAIMALAASVEDLGYTVHRSYDETLHTAPLTSLP